jgi:predicted Zn-dependent peptidase
MRQRWDVNRGEFIVTKTKSELEQMHLLMGLPAFPRSLERRYTLHVLNTILGGTMSSRLFQKIREERGLVYSVYSGVNTFADTGLLTVYAATNPKRAAEVIRLVVEELRKLRDDGPTEDELNVAKEHLKGSLMLALESTSSRMSNLARQEIYFGRQLTLEETIRGIEQVTRRKLTNMARAVLDGQRLSLGAVGRIGRLKLDDAGLVI